MSKSMQFDAVVRQPAYLQVASQLREAILSGQLAIGEPVPAERELCESFGVSRPTVREALRALQAQGLVVSGGATAPLRVAGPEDVTSGPLRDALEHLLRLASVPLRDLVDLRVALESAATRLATDRGAEADLTAVHAALEQAREAGQDMVAFHHADVQFHLTLVAASGNEALSLVMLAVRESMEAHLLEALRARDDQGATARLLTAEHEGILKAVEAGDAELAESLARAHIEGFYRRSMASE